MYVMNMNTPELLKPETQLLMSCASTEGSRSKILEIVNQDINWIYLIHLAEYHDVLQLLYLNIREICPHIVPLDIFTYLEERFQENVKNSLLITAELFKVFRLLQENEINAIPFKGPSLAVYAYENLSLRISRSIDVYIPEEDTRLARLILSSQGYQKKFGGSKTFPHYSFANEQSGANVEVHWKFPTYPFSFPHEFDKCINLSELPKLEINNNHFPSLLPEDQILVLSLRNAASNWYTLSKICDISELVKHQKINWHSLLEKGDKLYLKRIVLTNLSLAHQLLDLKLPGFILNEINADNKLEVIKQLIINDFLFFYRYIQNTLYQEASLHLKIREHSLYGIKDFFNLLTASDGEGKKSLTSRYIKDPLKLIQNKGLVRPRVFVNYAPSSPSVIDHMLKLADVTENDVVYDLGCGGGHIVIMAAKKYGARGVGVDVDPDRIIESRKNAKKEGVETLTKFIEKDIFKTNLAEASVITLWLTPLHMEKLKSKFKEELLPNTRIVSRNFEMEGMVPKKTAIVKSDQELSRIYLWQI